MRSWLRCWTRHSLAALLWHAGEALDTARGWEFKANPRYRLELLKKLGLDGLRAKSVGTPCADGPDLAGLTEEEKDEKDPPLARVAHEEYQSATGQPECVECEAPPDWTSPPNRV